MDFRVDVSNKVDEKDWNDNLMQSKFANGYQIANFAMVYHYSFDSIPLFIYVKNSNNKIVGQLAATINTKYYLQNSNVISRIIGTKLKWNPILRWEYGPIIHDKSNQDEILSKILSTVDTIALRNRVTMISCTVSPLDVLLPNQIFEKYGYYKKNWSTYVTDINQNIDELYKKLSKETRYDIRKSEKNGLEFVIASNFKEYDEYANLSIKIRKSRGQLVKKSKSFNYKFWNILHDDGYLKVFLVRKNGELLGGMDALVFNNNILQYGVSISQQGQKLEAGSFLTWNVIKWAVNMGYQTFDLAGINPNPETEKESAIRFFKSKWGGRRLDYVRYVKVMNKFRLRVSSVLNNPYKLRKITNIIK